MFGKIRQIISIFIIALAIVALFHYERSIPKYNIPVALDDRLKFSLEIADIKLRRTIDYLEAKGKIGQYYPSFTHNSRLKARDRVPDGAWVTAKPKSWTAGMFPAILWQMQSLAQKPQEKAFWREEAEKWSEPLRKIGESGKYEDVTLNNLFVFRPWYDATTGVERQRQLKTILQGASHLIEPFDGEINKVGWNERIGTIGWLRRADRRDNQIHWHVFIDHIINIEHLLWAAEHHPDRVEGQKWHDIARKHLKTIAKTFETRQTSGSWQRGYFDSDRQSPTYGQFLFSEGKQGWKDDSIWSRGQAWVIYAACIAYQYTEDKEILTIAQRSIDYFLNNLLPNQYIPPWDFDYAKQVNPDTKVDSSAATIAIAGMLKLIRHLPENNPHRSRYLQRVEQILNKLTSAEYLSLPHQKNASIILRGCYHHPKAIVASRESDNGLIWGDYFFLDALREYQLANDRSTKQSAVSHLQKSLKILP
jgi:unsaturated chondroitin disaccharide hydrolase